MAQARREEQFNRALTEHVHLGAGRPGPVVCRDTMPKRAGSAVAMTRCACGKSFTGHAWGPGKDEWGDVTSQSIETATPRDIVPTVSLHFAQWRVMRSAWVVLPLNVARFLHFGRSEPVHSFHPWVVCP